MKRQWRHNIRKKVHRSFGSHFRAAIAAGAILSAVLSGGGIMGGTAAAAAPVTITYLTHWPPPQVALLSADAKRFHKLYPNITVNFHAVPFADLLTTLTTEGPTAGYTVASVYDLWLPQLVHAGLIAPAPTYVANDVKANWPTNLVKDVTKQGAIRGIPNEVDLWLLVYNKALFAKAGISSPPTNWTQLVADAGKITNKSEGTQGFGVATDWAAGTVHPWLSLVDSNGGQLLVNGKPDLTSPKVEAVTKLYQELVKDGYTVASMSGTNAEDTGPYLDNFTSGHTGMMILLNADEAYLKEGFGSKFSSDVGVAPIPVGPDGTKSRPVSYSWLTLVNSHASAAEQAAGWKFLDWLNGPTSGPHGSSAMAKALLSLGVLPSRKSDDIANKAELSSSFLKEYVSQLPDADPFPITLGGEQMTDQIESAVESVIFGKASATSAMATAQSEVSATLTEASS